MAPSSLDRHRRVASAAVLVAVAATPAVFAPPMADAFGLPKLLLVAACGVGGWAAWVTRPPLRKRAAERAQREPVDRRPEWAVGAYVGVVALATAFSIGRYDSLFGSYERYGGLLPLLVYLAVAGLFVAVAREAPVVVDRFPAAVAVGVVLPATYVLLQTAGLDFLDWKDAAGNEVRYAAGTMGNADFAGGWLGIAAPFLALLAWQRRWTVVVGLLAATALVATRSRGGLLAAVVGVAVLAGLERARLPRSVRRLLLAGAVIGVAGAAALLALPESARPVVVQRTDLLRTESAVERGRQWAAAVTAFGARPLLGHGPDTFEFVYPTHRSEADGRKLGLVIADKPHNVLLEKASDTGVLGLAAYLAVLLSVAATGRRARPRPPLLSAFLAGLAAYLAQAVVSIDVPPLALVGWLLLAGVVATARGPLSDRTVGRAPPRRARRPVIAVAVLALAALVAPVTADLAAADGRWDVAADRNPTQPAYRLGLGAALERAQGSARALPAFEQARRMQPRSVLAAVGIARMHTRLGRYDEADGWWRWVADADPVDWQVHSEWALMLNAWSNRGGGDATLRRQAAERLERAVAIKPDHVHGLVNLAKIRLSLGEHAAARTAVAHALALDPGHVDANAVAAEVARAQGSSS